MKIPIRIGCMQTNFIFDERTSVGVQWNAAFKAGSTKTALKQNNNRKQHE